MQNHSLNTTLSALKHRTQQ